MLPVQGNDLRLICGNRNYSSWSLRAWLCLRKAGIDPVVTVVPMDTEEFEERIGALSPTRRVPALWIRDACIWDSLAIAETVNERFAGCRLWPDDPGLRALGRSMAAEMHSGFAALRDALPMNCRAVGREVSVDAAVQEDIARICDLWQDARQRAEDGAWLLGPWSIADAMYAPVVLRFRAYRVDLPDSVRAYCRHVLCDEHMQEWIAEAEAEPWVIEHEEVGSS